MIFSDDVWGLKRVATRAYVRIAIEVQTGIGLHRVGSPLVGEQWEFRNEAERGISF